jgi:hypothetical protein
MEAAGLCTVVQLQHCGMRVCTARMPDLQCNPLQLCHAAASMAEPQPVALSLCGRQRGRPCYEAACPVEAGLLSASEAVVIKC